jgi:hypothetical protein
MFFLKHKRRPILTENPVRIRESEYNGRLAGAGPSYPQPPGERSKRRRPDGWFERNSSTISQNPFMMRTWNRNLRLKSPMQIANRNSADDCSCLHLLAFRLSFLLRTSSKPHVALPRSPLSEIQQLPQQNRRGYSSSPQELCTTSIERKTCLPSTQNKNGCWCTPPTMCHG